MCSAEGWENNETWARIVGRILAGEPEGQAELYEVFDRGLRVYFVRHLGTEDVEDKVHDTFIAVVAAIRGGQMREALRLPGLVRIIAQRQVAYHAAEAARCHPESLDTGKHSLAASDGLDPEREALLSERQQFARRILRALPEIDRQILRRFYFEGQSAEQICAAFRINPTQFRLRKHRAKERISELAREVMKKKPARELLLRKQAASGH